MNRTFTIYVALCITTDKLYFGVTSTPLTERIRRHLASAKKPRYRFPAALKKHGAHNFVWFAIGTVQGEADAREVERALIRYFGTTSFDKGYNSTAGGEGTRVLTKASRAKLSASLSGRQFSEEHLRNLRAARNRRPPPSEETRLKMSRSMQGRKMNFSPEALARISAANKGKKRSQETRERIGIAHAKVVGKPRPVEVREKIRATMKMKMKMKKESNDASV